jgi:predicted nucleic acid-binding protein
LVIERRERTLLPSLVLYEWLRGPRLKEELRAQEALFPAETAVPFGPAEAREAARLYGATTHARGREIDLAIAAIAILRNAHLWTLNSRDFADIPGLKLFSP